MTKQIASRSGLRSENVFLEVTGLNSSKSCTSKGLVTMTKRPVGQESSISYTNASVISQIAEKLSSEIWNWLIPTFIFLEVSIFCLEVIYSKTLITLFLIFQKIFGKLNMSGEYDDLWENIRETYKHDVSGKNVLSLPFENNPQSFSGMGELTSKRFFSSERRLLKNSCLYEEYSAFMREYFDYGHMYSLFIIVF